MTHTFRTFSAATTLAATLLAGAAVAQATPPDKAVVPFSGTIENWVECPAQGFNIRIQFFGSDTFKTFYDQAGNITRLTDHSHGTGTLINQNDPTKTETGSSPTNQTVDFVNGTFTISGMSFHNNIPGLGRVAQDNGTITFALSSFDPQTGDFEIDFDRVLHSGGPHPGFENIDWCSMVA
jgi:hypothetical protein